MGKAHHGPNLRNIVNIEFTTHAMEKLRERLPSGSHYNSMPDPDLKLRVEEAWAEANRTKTVEEWWQHDDRGTAVIKNLVVDLSPLFDCPLVALFRPHAHTGLPVVITVMTADMVAAKKTANHWARDPASLGGPRLLSTPMRDLLPPPQPLSPEVPISGVTQVVAKKTPAGAIRPALVKPVPVEPKSEEKKAPDYIVVSYFDNVQGKLEYSRMEKHEVSNFVSDLVENGYVDQESIRFWAELVAKVKKTITVEF